MMSGLEQTHKFLITGVVVLRANKKRSMFRVTGLKILGRVGKHILTDFKNATLG